MQHTSEPRDIVRRRFGPFGRIELPSFSATNFGLKCRFPIIESEGLTVAVLLCDTGREHLGLLLHPSKPAIQDPSRNQYHCGCCFMMPYILRFKFARLISLGSDFYNLMLNGKIVKAEWRDIFIADSSHALTKDVVLTRLSSQWNRIAPIPPFRLPHWLISKLMEMGMDPLPLQIASRPVNGTPLQMAAVFVNTDAWEGIRLILGTCTQSPGRPPLHWAKAGSQTANNWSFRTDYSHDCSVHHIETWRGWKKDFGASARDPRIIRLSFSPCKLTPSHTLVINVELKGRVYDAMKDRKTVVLPLREGPGFANRVPHSTTRVRNGYHWNAATVSLDPPNRRQYSGPAPYGTAMHHLGYSTTPAVTPQWAG